MSTILTLSKQAVYDLIISQEVSSKEMYDAKYRRPIWPGGDSGITFAFGYDVGKQRPAQVLKDWNGILHPEMIARLQKYCGRTGPVCKTLVLELHHVIISWETAQKGFYCNSLPRYCKMAADTYPGLDKIHPYEQTAIVGLVYNRGTKLTGDSRKEMLQMKEAIANDNDTEMAALIKSMERLWQDKGMLGIIKRRELEAKYIAYPDDPIPEADKLLIEL